MYVTQAVLPTTLPPPSLPPRYKGTVSPEATWGARASRLAKLGIPGLTVQHRPSPLPFPGGTFLAVQVCHSYTGTHDRFSRVLFMLEDQVLTGQGQKRNTEIRKQVLLTNAEVSPCACTPPKPCHQVGGSSRHPSGWQLSFPSAGLPLSVQY